ncbi:MAG: HAD-IIB family hydrolase [Candidatus Dormibacteria bacterium]
MKRLVVFDLDGTLAPSKAPPDAAMAGLLNDLLGVVKVAVISGGSWTQFEKQLLARLPGDGRLAGLSLLPVCGTQFFQYAGGWTRLYSEDLTPEERSRIAASLRKALKLTGFGGPTVWGDLIEDRGSQMTLSALGQEAPLAEKEAWDPDYAKRTWIKAVLDTLLPDFSVRIGGATSIDVTKPGIDKAYGIRKLRDRLGISLEDMLYVGDALFAGGNDHPALEAGVACIAVRGPEDTKLVIETLVACLGGTVARVGAP